ncbi:MAG: zf-HC2 domain-containing protein, partial [Planctomycetota bacterium]
MADCLTRDEFEHRLRGELTAGDAARFDNHIAVCERCRAEYQSLVEDHRFLDGFRNALGASGLDETASRGSEAPGQPAEAGPTTWPYADAAPDASSDRAERFPEIIGYSIKRVLGRGGMGVVYEAIQEKLNRKVALKLLPALVSSTHPEFVTRFQREATAAAKLHHT